MKWTRRQRLALPTYITPPGSQGALRSALYCLARRMSTEYHTGVMYCFAAYHKARPSRAINEDVYYYYYYNRSAGRQAHGYIYRQ